MNEIWPMEVKEEKRWYCIYSEDTDLCRYFARSPGTEWFGTYTKGNKWVAEQYRFPEENYNIMAKLAGLTSRRKFYTTDREKIYAIPTARDHA